MLLYYFSDRDEVLDATLKHLAARLAGLLDAALPDASPRPFARLLAQAWAVMGAAQGRPYRRLWLELVAQAAGGVQPHRAIAGSIFAGFLDWVEARLDIADPADRHDAAQLLLSAVEGLLVADAVGGRDTADAAARRLGRLAGGG
jgi:AcrR family transcriptional regulator